MSDPMIIDAACGMQADMDKIKQANRRIAVRAREVLDGMCAIYVDMDKIKQDGRRSAVHIREVYGRLPSADHRDLANPWNTQDPREVAWRDGYNEEMARACSPS